jgi:hypothetical protein
MTDENGHTQDADDVPQRPQMMTGHRYHLSEADLDPELDAPVYGRLTTLGLDSAQRREILETLRRSILTITTALALTAIVVTAYSALLIVAVWLSINAVSRVLIRVRLLGEAQP